MCYLAFIAFDVFGETYRAGKYSVLGLLRSFPGIYLLAGRNGLSFPAGKLYQGERCGEGETEKPPNSGIASNRAAKKGYTSPMLFYLLIKTNSQIKRISLYRHCTLCQNREKQKASRYRH